ncbi:hypothetical protein ATCC90586_011550 [Pythium insidiosum]|nr:hypothetical protein ATCC90586_011550 [Pythium insidiosum]
MAGGVALNVDNSNYDDVPTEGKRTYAIIVCLFASLGGLFFGYDQGVTGGVLVMKSFTRDFCVDWNGFNATQCEAAASDLPTKWLDFTLWYNMTYNIGCIFGALIGGYVADRFGRRVTIFNAGLLFCIGTTWVIATPAHHHGLLLVARVINGMGVGNSS